jgi:hypothetical protein
MLVKSRQHTHVKKTLGKRHRMGDFTEGQRAIAAFRIEGLTSVLSKLQVVSISPSWKGGADHSKNIANFFDERTGCGSRR